MNILIVDDHILFREGLVLLLKKQPDFTVVGEAGTVGEAVELAIQEDPDIILMDFSLPDGTGLDATQAILSKKPAIKIVFLTIHETDDRLLAAIRSGAKGYLLKNIPVASLLTSLRAVENGDPAISPKMTARIFEEFAHEKPVAASEPQTAQISTLTHREKEVLSLIALGLANREIAEKLYISENTVKNHIHNLLEKLSLSNRREAIQYARRYGFVKE